MVGRPCFSPVGATPYAAAQVSWGFGSRGMVPGRVEVPEGRLVSYHPLPRSRRGQRCRVIVLLQQHRNGRGGRLAAGRRHAWSVGLEN